MADSRSGTSDSGASSAARDAASGEAIAAGYHPDPARSHSLKADAYTEPVWFERDQRDVLSKTWQWLCHGESLRSPGSYVTDTIADMPVVAVRDGEGTLRAFYNVCKHRAHELLSGTGSTNNIVCPYHAWSYNLDGRLMAARHTGGLVDFDTDEICLDEVQVAEFGGFVFINLDPTAAPLHQLAADLEAEILHWAPDVHELTHAHRLTYRIESNWKNVVDNFLECYHCHVAHKDFVSLVDMDTYTVTTHGIYSSHMAEAGKSSNSAYDVTEATVTDHAVWWLWPNTCIMRYPGRGNIIVLKIIPQSNGSTFETYDFFLESAEPNDAELESIRYLDEVLQPEDIALVESVQRGMRTPGFTQGRIVNDPNGSGLSEHAVHHFHGLMLDAYRAGWQATDEAGR